MRREGVLGFARRSARLRRASFFGAITDRWRGGGGNGGGGGGGGGNGNEGGMNAREWTEFYARHRPEVEVEIFV